MMCKFFYEGDILQLYSKSIENIIYNLNENESQ